MIKKIKEIIDSGDVRRLKYIFVDALDVDPTFVRYEEAYNYVKSVPGILEPHIDLTPFRISKTDWDEQYWVKLKMDLANNFSDIRMMHMREVAQVYLAEKVQRILAERASKNSSYNNDSSNNVIVPVSVRENIIVNNHAATIPTKAEQERAFRQKQLQLAEENRLFDEERAREERMAKAQEEHKQDSDGLSKKALGVAIAAVVGMAILYQILN